MGEWGHVFGLPSTSSVYAPCALCESPRGELHSQYCSMSVLQWPWQCVSDESYERDCRRCERRVNVASEGDRQVILAALEYQKGRKDRGRAITVNLEQFGILQGDRLEMTPWMTDVALFETQPVPFRAVFWRVHRADGGALEDRVVRRCPIFRSNLEHRHTGVFVMICYIHSIMDPCSAGRLQ